METTLIVTLIVALITAIAAIVAPLIAAIINSRSAYKVKTAELYFMAKSDAYKAFLHSTSNVSGLTFQNSETLRDVHETASVAQMYSSENTQKKIAEYCLAWSSNDNRALSNQKLAAAHKAVILAMQQDLQRPAVISKRQ